MNRRADRLAALARLTEAAFLAEQSRMARLNAREAEIAARLRALDEGRAARDGMVALDEARRAGADPIWHRWMDGQRSAMNAEMARLRVAQERAQVDLARAFGRHNVARTLAGREVDRTRAAAPD